MASDAPTSPVTARATTPQDTTNVVENSPSSSKGKGLGLLPTVAVPRRAATMNSSHGEPKKQKQVLRHGKKASSLLSETNQSPQRTKSFPIYRSATIDTVLSDDELNVPSAGFTGPGTQGMTKVITDPKATSGSVPSSADLITLEGKEDPHNWSYAYKWTTVAIVSLMGFISPMGASIIVPGSRMIDAQFHLQSRTLSIVPVSTYVLGLALGPFVFAPASELIGRRPVYMGTALVFVLFNIACGLVDNFAGLNVVRFLAGAFGSTGPTLGSGSIGDMFSPRERGRAVSLYGLGPLLGPVVGNLIGGFIAQAANTWRWLIWTLTIFSAAIALVIIFLLEETYGPVLLDRKRRKARAEIIQAAVAASSSPPPSLWSRLQSKSLKVLRPSKQAKSKFTLAMTRPFRLLFTNPICAIFSVYLGFVYGEIFIFLTQHPLLFQRREPPIGPPDHDAPDVERLPTYGWTPGQAGLSYIGLGIGFIVAMLINAMFQDSIYQRLVASNGRVGWFLLTKRADTIWRRFPDTDAVVMTSGRTPDLEKEKRPSVQRKGKPEYRLPFCLLGMLTLPAGLLIFGWAAQNRMHWSIPLLGSMLTGMSTILCFQTILVYLVDAFVPFSASATACCVLVRSLLAAAFPLFAESLYSRLGFGWGSTLLALVGLLGVPVPIVLFRYGEALRTLYKFEG